MTPVEFSCGVVDTQTDEIVRTKVTIDLDEVVSVTATPDDEYTLLVTRSGFSYEVAGAYLTVRARVWPKNRFRY